MDPRELPPIALSTCNIVINYDVAKDIGLDPLKNIIMENSGPLNLNLILKKEKLISTEEEIEIEEDNTPIKIRCNVVFNVQYSEEFISQINERPEIIEIWFN